MKDINILVFGDSIAYGACDKEYVGWINRLKLDLEIQDKNNNYYSIFNLGIPGNTSSELRKRFKQEYNARHDQNARNIIIFSIGINDSQIINEKNRVSESNFVKNIVFLIKQARKFTNNILFIGLTRVDESKVMPVPWNSSIYYTNNEICKFDNSLANICSHRDISYLDVSNLLDNEDLDDGLHPNSNGHQKLYEKIYKQLEALEWI